LVILLLGFISVYVFGWCFMILNPLFWTHFRKHRILTISGPYGTGKTLLGVAIAQWLKEGWGYRVWSNFPVEFADPVEMTLPRHTVIHLDEPGHFLDARSWRTNDLSFADYARKLDFFILLTGKKPVDVQLRQLEAQRRLRMLFGPAMWIFTMFDDLENSWIVPLLSPGSYFGRYDTEAIESALLYHVVNGVMRAFQDVQQEQQEEAEARVSEARDKIYAEVVELLES
jgi:hypothetical protein